MISMLVGLLLIGLIVWWFWLYKPSDQGVDAVGVIEIIVDHGVYTPALIKAKVGNEITLRFIRKAESPCASVVMFPEIDKNYELPVNQPFDVVLTINKPGEYNFTCEMAMYRGKLIVV